MKHIVINFLRAGMCALVLVAASGNAAAATSTTATSSALSFCFDLAGASPARFGFQVVRARVFHYIEAHNLNCGVAPSSAEPQSAVEAVGASFRNQVTEAIKSWVRAWFEAILGRFIK